MFLTFEAHGDRLMRDLAARSPDLVGGFMLIDRATGLELVFAVEPVTREAFARMHPAGSAEFDGPGWMPCRLVPGAAEWIGCYPRPIFRSFRPVPPLFQRGAPDAR